MKDSLEMADDEYVAMAAALEVVVALDGWKVVEGLSKRSAEEMALRLLDDDTLTKEHVKGYVEGVRAIVNKVQTILARAKEIKGERAEGANELYRTGRVGGGNLAE